MLLPIVYESGRCEMAPIFFLQKQDSVVCKCVTEL